MRAISKFTDFDVSLLSNSRQSIVKTLCSAAKCKLFKLAGSCCVWSLVYNNTYNIYIPPLHWQFVTRTVQQNC